MVARTQPEDAQPSEREQLLLAERDVALAAVRALIAMIAKHGGYMTPEHQIVYRDAKALVGIGPIAKPWSNR